MKILLLDNYDSFTYNLKQLLEKFPVTIDIIRNDKISVEAADEYDAFIFSPGPGLPDSAGNLKSIIKEYIGKKPMLGICLGMQAIAEVFGNKLKQLPAPIHGKSSTVEHYGEKLFSNIPAVFQAGRYHSWVVDEEGIYQNFILTARDQSRLVMGIRSREYPIYGLQFHPESILSDKGDLLIENFLEIAKNYSYETVA